MEISITAMTVFSVILMASGAVLLFLLPLVPASKDRSQGQSVTVKGTSGSIVTVRNASGSDVSVIFDNPVASVPQTVVPVSPSGDRAAEDEITVIDELKDPGTSAQRKKAIEDELLALGYRIVGRHPVPENAVGKSDPSKAEGVRPEKMPSSAKPSEPEDEDGSDELLWEQEPQFDEFYSMPNKPKDSSAL